jgi:hypothetical protein
VEIKVAIPGYTTAVAARGSCCCSRIVGPRRPP